MVSFIPGTATLTSATTTGSATVTVNAAAITDNATVDFTYGSGTHYRSIGIDASVLYSFGDASISSGTTTVTFGSGASLPTNVGVGDELVIGGEVFHILSRDTATQVTVQAAASANHVSDGYSISRAFNTFASWEAARDGDLVADNRVEVGVAYDDGAFTPTAEILFQDSTTSAANYMWLTVAAGQQHNGVAGTGVRVDGSSIAAGNLLFIRDPYVRIEWLEIYSYPGDTAIGNPIYVREGEAQGAYFSHLLIHDYTDNFIRGAINIYDDTTVRNSVFYNGPTGLRTYGADNPQVTIENVTIYGMSLDGIEAEAAGTYYIKNTISVGSGGEDFDINDAGVVIDPSSGYNLYSTVRLGVHPGTNNQSPPASLEDLFISIVPTSENLHLELAGHNAIDNGTDLSGSFTVDIDLDTRPIGSAWDIGADEA